MMNDDGKNDSSMQHDNKYDDDDDDDDDDDVFLSVCHVQLAQEPTSTHLQLRLLFIVMWSTSLKISMEGVVFSFPFFLRFFPVFEVPLKLLTTLFVDPIHTCVTVLVCITIWFALCLCFLSFKLLQWNHIFPLQCTFSNNY